MIEDLLAEADRRIAAGCGVLPADAARIYWVNPVADLRAMNLLEDAGGRMCGGENLFCHALCPIPVDLPPLEALARTALADPMVGPAADRAEYVCREMRRRGAEAMIVSRIPGASHCAAEGTILAEVVRGRLGVPALEIEVPPVLDAMEPTLRTRLGSPGGNRPREEAIMLCAGIDAGSRTVKVALIDAESFEVAAVAVADQGVRQDAVAAALMDRALAEAGRTREEVRLIVATGYGRKLIRAADKTITEITCQACGVHWRLPEAKTIINVGGQDSKLLWLDGDGSVADFVMNDRCAAGTGRFLEVLAARLGVPLAELGELARRSRRPAAISSMCVVFAETEIVGLLASGAAPEDIVAGVQASIAVRVAALAGRRAAAPVVFTGGVALAPGMTEALAAALGMPVVVAPQPQITAALGAAILAAGQLQSREKGR